MMKKTIGKILIGTSLLAGSIAQADSVLFEDGLKTKDFLLGITKVGNLPKGLEVSPDGSKVYVANLNGTIPTREERKEDGLVKHPDTDYNASVSVVDMKTLKLVDTVYTPNGVFGKGRSAAKMLGNAEIKFTPDGRFAMTSRVSGCESGKNCWGGEPSSEVSSTGLVSVIDTKTQKVIRNMAVWGRGTKIISIRPEKNPEDYKFAYVANWFTDNVSVIRIDNLALNEQEQRAYDQNGVVPYTSTNPRGSGPFTRIQLKTQHPAKGNYKVGPRGIEFTKDGRYAIVFGYNSESMFIIDAQTHKQVLEVAPYNEDWWEDSDVRKGERILGRDLTKRELAQMDNGDNQFIPRHIVLSQNGEVAYVSLMRGNSLMKLDMVKFQELVEAMVAKGQRHADKSFWQKILIPWQAAQGEVVLRMEDYDSDHPLHDLLPEKFAFTHPNTIVLDPMDERYLYVSHRTTGLLSRKFPVWSRDGKRSLPRDMIGKVDVIDTVTGNTVMSLTAGSAPTALGISPDGSTLVSSGFRDDTIHFFNTDRIKKAYNELIFSGKIQ
jgi:DNA-binding beta-propeller fold protein YncE